MFDVGFTELLVIGVVALIVIGPERLPKVARTAGHLLGRLQRYVGDVKSDIEREMRLEEMKKLQADVEAQARGIETQVRSEMHGVESALAAPAEPLADLMQTTGQTVSHDVAALADVPATPGTGPATPASADAVQLPSTESNKSA